MCTRYRRSPFLINMGTGISLPAYFFFCAVLAVLYILVLHYTGFQPGMARCALCHWSTFSRQARVIRGCDWWCTVTWSLALRHSKMSPSVWLPFCWGTYWWLGLARTIYMHRIWPYICCGAFGDFPNKSTVYTPYIYGSGQPYSCVSSCVLQELVRARWHAQHATS